MKDLKDNDNQGFIQKVENLSDRELLNFMRVYTEESDYKLDIHKTDKPTFIKKITNNNDIEQATNLLDYTLNKYMVNENHFHWLHKNLRAQIFTLIYIRNYHSFKLKLVNKSYENEGRGYLFPIQFNHANVDCNGEIIDEVYEVLDKNYITESPITKSNKEELMEGVRALWSVINQDCDYTEWVNESYEDKVSWLERYLKRKGYYIDTIKATSTLEQRKALCLASLDLMEFKSIVKSSHDYSKSREKADFIDRMNRSWNQKVYRNSGRERKKYHVPLTKETKRRLDELAKAQDIKQAEVLETLINNSYKSKCLDYNGNDKY